MKGQKNECEYSKIVHASGLPVLIDAQLFREMDLGQIDLCRFQKTQIEIFEIKSNHFEIRVSPSQRKRLLRAGYYLSSLLGAPSILRDSLS